METMYDNTKKSKLTNTTKENSQYYEPTIEIKVNNANKENYYQINYVDEITKLNVEKQQLILEDKIKNLSQMTAQFIHIGDKVTTIPEIKIEILQYVLDFVNKGGKE